MGSYPSREHRSLDAKAARILQRARQERGWRSRNGPPIQTVAPVPLPPLPALDADTDPADLWDAVQRRAAIKLALMLDGAHTLRDITRAALGAVDKHLDYRDGRRGLATGAGGNLIVPVQINITKKEYDAI